MQLLRDEIAICHNLTCGVMLYGTEGTGKSCCASLLPKLWDTSLAKRPYTPSRVNAESLFPHAGLYVFDWSKEQHNIALYPSADVVEAVRMNFGRWQRGASNFGYVLIDDIDGFSAREQQHLRSTMDGTENIVWIFTTNSVESVDAALKRRCYLLDFTAAPVSAWQTRCNQLCKQYAVRKLSLPAMQKLLKSTNGNARLIMQRFKTQHLKRGKRKY